MKVSILSSFITFFLSVNSFAINRTCEGPVKEIMLHTDGRLHLKIADYQMTVYCSVKSGGIANLTSEQCRDIYALAKTSQLTGRALALWFSTSGAHCQEYLNDCNGGSWCNFSTNIFMFGLR